jgi:hypothetical protein
MLAPGEHVWSADEVDKAGGHGVMYAMRNAVKHFDTGGAVGGDGGLTLPPTPGGLAAVNSLLQQLSGAGGGSRTPYQLGGFSAQGIDCSGLVSAVVNAYLGQSPFGGRMSTGNEGTWLQQRGFREGVGPPGSLQVGWSGAHTAMSVNGTNVESTTSNGISGVRTGGLAASPMDSQFSRHMYLPVGIESIGGKPVGGTDGGSGGGSGGGGDDPFSSLMGIAKGGLKESLLPPGFIDYSQTSWGKSAGAAVKMLMGGGGLGGLLPKGFGDLLMHPVKAAMNAGKNGGMQVGWGGKPVSPGEGQPASLARSATGRPAGNLAQGEHTSGGPGFTVNVNAPTLSGSVKDINDTVKDHKANASRKGPSSQASTSRIGQPGG